MYTFCTFGISRDPRPQGGETFIYRAAKRFPHTIEIVAIDLAKLGIEAPAIDRPDLIETDVFILIAEADIRDPRSLPQLGRRGGDQIKPVRQFPHDQDGREKRSLLPFTSEPTFSPRDAHHKSRSETNGGLCCDRCNFSLSPIHAIKRFTR